MVQMVNLIEEVFSKIKFSVINYSVATTGCHNCMNMYVKLSHASEHSRQFTFNIYVNVMPFFVFRSLFKYYYTHATKLLFRNNNFTSVSSFISVTMS